MIFQKIQKTASTKTETPTTSQLKSRPFASNVQHPTPTPLQQPQQTEGLVQRKTGLMSEPKIKQPEVIQAKLTIGEPGDKYEQEADTVAHQVVQRLHAPISTSNMDINQKGSEFVQRMKANTLQRSHRHQEEISLPKTNLLKRPAIGTKDRIMSQTQPMLQRREHNRNAMTAPSDFEASIEQERGSGQPLADNVREPIGQLIGADLSGVKVHTDAKSHQLNKSIQARAFTTKKDMFFAKGQYNPGSREGQELIAHEAVHIKQQNGNAVQLSQETHLKTGQSSYGVIQRDEEVDAAARTANLQIRRGNRRGSIAETGQESSEKVEFLRDHIQEIESEIKDRLKRDETTFIYQLFGKRIEEVLDNKTYFRAILTEWFKAGNCDEFAASTYTYLMRHTNHKNIYIAQMKGVDINTGKPFAHTVTITSPQNVNDPAELDPETALVVDAWFNYKVLKLAQFYNGVNPYRARIDASNIHFEEKGLSTGGGAFAEQGEFAAEVIRYITDAAQEMYNNYMAQYMLDMSDNSSDDNRDMEESEDIFDFERVGRNVDDMR